MLFRSRSCTLRFTVRTWIQQGCKPDWSLMRSGSPALKAYWQQFDSLIIEADVVYRQLQILHTEDEPEKQLLLPYSLQEGFLKAIHEGVAGHLGTTKTCAHVGQTAYWFQWRRNVNIFYSHYVIYVMSFTMVRLLLSKGS